MKDSKDSNTALIRATVFAAAFGAAVPVFATAHDHLPPEHTHGAVAYRSGGIGEDESTAMKQAANNYSLELLMVKRDDSGAAGYLAGNRVSIRDHGGKEILNTVAAGPFLLAQLPEGRYTITAWYDGAVKEHSVTLAPHKRERVVFEW